MNLKTINIKSREKKYPNNKITMFIKDKTANTQRDRKKQRKKTEKNKKKKSYFVDKTIK